VKLILRKVVIIVATRCHILKLKCTKFDFGWGSAQTPLGERGKDGEGEGKGCIVPVGGWTPRDGFIYILALTPAYTISAL